MTGWKERGMICMGPTGMTKLSLIPVSCGRIKMMERWGESEAFRPVTWADACSCSRPTGHTLGPRRNQHPARAVFGKCCKFISGKISAPFTTIPVKPEGFQQPCHPIITDCTKNLQLGKIRDQKKATQMYKKCLEGNVWQMKGWKERVRNRENEEQTAYLKTLQKLIKKMKILASYIQYFKSVYFFFDGTPTEIFNRMFKLLFSIQLKWMGTRLWSSQKQN